MGLEFKTVFCGKKFPNPAVLPSGFLGVNAEVLLRVLDEGGAGAVTMKSIGLVEREGNPNPTVVPWEHGVINAVGLPTPGIENLNDEWQGLNGRMDRVIASILGGSFEDFEEVAKAVAVHKPALIEPNISCPHAKGHGQAFGLRAEDAAKVTEKVKNAVGKIPVMPKMTPQAHDIGEVAKACVDAGADAICAINTVGPGMLINIEARAPVLANKRGGLSGPAIKPIGVRCVYDIYEATGGEVPILGMGGISHGRDLIEYAMAGASMYGIGTAIHYTRDLDVFGDVLGETEKWMNQEGVKNLKDVVGVAHK